MDAKQFKEMLEERKEELDGMNALEFYGNRVWDHRMDILDAIEEGYIEGIEASQVSKCQRGSFWVRFGRDEVIVSAGKASILYGMQPRQIVTWLD